MILRVNTLYNLRLLFRETVRSQLVNGFVILKSIRGGSSRRVTRYAGIDVSRNSSRE